MWDTLHETVGVFQVFSSEVCNATIKRTHCCISMARLPICIILLTDVVCQQYKGKALLFFHGEMVARTRHNITLQYIACLILITIPRILYSLLSIPTNAQHTHTHTYIYIHIYSIFYIS